MKKLSIALIVTMMLFAFVSCATKAPAAAPVVEDDQWWMNIPESTADMAYAVGSANGPTLSISREWAKAAANQNMAEWVSTSVEGITTIYTNAAGEAAKSGNNMQAMQAFEQVSKQNASALLTGVTYKFHEGADGTIYALASMPVGPVAEAFKETVREQFTKNEAAVEANNMMNDAIDKYFGRN